MGHDDRKRQEKEIKRQDIIDAAERVFFTNGYKNSSMDAVAKEAEFSKRTVYVYFSSKEQIYYEIMIRGYRLLLSMLEDCFKRNCRRPPRKSFAAFSLHCIPFTKTTQTTLARSWNMRQRTQKNRPASTMPQEPNVISLVSRSSVIYQTPLKRVSERVQLTAVLIVKKPRSSCGHTPSVFSTLEQKSADISKISIMFLRMSS